MATRATVELRDLVLAVQLGTYGPGDVMPRQHMLDMTLQVDPDLVLVPGDGMAHVFDYDPLIAEIGRLAGDGPYETQEWLLSRIVTACGVCPEIKAVDLCLRKAPVFGDSGTVGVRLSFNATDFATWKADRTGAAGLP